MVLALAALLLPLPAIAAGPEKPRFNDSTDVISIEVPVQVVRDGEPVRGLKAEDFAVFEGRKRQPIVGFEVLDLDAVPAASAVRAGAVPAAARRYFLLLFDLSSSEPKSIVKAREAAHNLVDKQMKSTDLVAVASYSASKGPQLLLGFTSDPKQIGTAIQALGLPELIDRNPDPLNLVLGEIKGEIAGSYHPGKNYDTEEMLDSIQLYMKQAEKANREVDKAKVSALTRSFSDLAKLMGSVHGRKQVVYLSEGFDSALVLGKTSLQDVQDMALQTEDTPWEVDNEARYGSTETGNAVERMLEEFRRADCVIQAVDIGGLRGQGDQGVVRPSGEDGLFLMANETGGELYRNFNDLGEAMGQMLKRTSVTYVLSFQPEKLRRDGSYHRLRVELPNAPRGTRVVARPGYYAPRPFAEQSAVERLLRASTQVMGAAEPGTIGASVLAAAFRSDRPSAYVPILIEADGAGLLAGKQGKVLPAEIYVYALDGQGVIQDFLTQRLALDVKKVTPALTQSGLKFFGHLELPVGDYSLRVLVRNGATGAFAFRAVPLTVPAFAPGAPVLLPPLFPEPANKWLIVRETPRGEQKQAPYPFLLHEEPFVPASKPMLTVGHEAQLALVAYNLAAGDLRAQGRLLAADGSPLGTADIVRFAREARSEPGPDRLFATFKAPSLAPGDYALRITLTDAAGKTESSTTPFSLAAEKPPAVH